MATPHVIGALDMMNLKITPMVYAGQDYSNDIGALYAKFVRGVSAKVTKKRRHD